MEHKVRMMMSNRHIHLSQHDKDVLFGEDYQLNVKNQITETVAATYETVTLRGPKGEIQNVRILLPIRKASQVELLRSDCFKIGVEAPIRQSGDVEGSGGITVIGPKGEVELKEGVIIAARHIHMDTEEAKALGIPDKGYVDVRFGGERPVVFERVWVRLKPGTNTVMHIDTEEGNACNLVNNQYGELLLDTIAPPVKKAHTHKLLVAGFGGQGVMVCGQMISYTAADTTDLKVVYYPAYGVEQRGGTANCSVILSDDEIGEPKTNSYDSMIIMNDASLDKFRGNLKPDGVLIYNRNTVKQEVKAEDFGKVVAVPAVDIAVEAGSEKSANLVMTGAFVGYTGMLPKENVMETIHKKLGKKRPELNPINDKAFIAGYEIGLAARK